MTREEVHERFNTFYNASKPPEPFELGEINDIENKIGVKLTESYVSFVLKYGAVYTPEILKLICTHSAEQQSLQNFHSADEVIDIAAGLKTWDENLPERLVPFASDSMGNVFIFNNLPTQGSRPDDSSIWFLDHDFATFEEIAPGFDAWLESYLKIGM